MRIMTPYTLPSLSRWLRPGGWAPDWRLLSYDYFMRAIQYEARIALERAFQKHVEEAYRHQAKLELATARYGRATQALSEAESGLRETVKGRWVKASLLLVAAAISLIAEYVFTLKTLPFLLEVKEPALRMLLSGIPVAAVVILDVILWRMLEDPWQTAKKHDPQLKASEHRAIKWAMRIVAVSIGVALLYMMYLLGQSREVAQYVITQLQLPLMEESPLALDVDRSLLNHTLTTLSIVMMVVGAMLTLLGMEEAHRCWERFKAKSAVLLCRRRRDHAEQLMVHRRAMAEAHHAKRESELRVAKARERSHVGAGCAEYELYQHRQSNPMQVVKDILAAGPRRPQPPEVLAETEERLAKRKSTK